MFGKRIALASSGSAPSAVSRGRVAQAGALAQRRPAGSLAAPSLATGVAPSGCVTTADYT